MRAIVAKPPTLSATSSQGQRIQGRTRIQWRNQWEFLMSCIATSVGLGNVWRFPYVAYQNGGGAFLLPYMIVLLVIGKPMYYLETTVGQFSSSNGVHIWSMAPVMTGCGYAQALCAGYVVSYYMSLVALNLYYLVISFSAELPWSVCRPGWKNCVPSGQARPNNTGIESTSSAEFYFTKVVLQQYTDIDNGIGEPLWYLALCLMVSWVAVFCVIIKGIKSTGKASYFLALFPYSIMLILLLRAVTLPGAGRGILFFVTPQWHRLSELKVWYAAVTQCFFSLSVGSGSLIMFSSYNSFKGNTYRLKIQERKSGIRLYRKMGSSNCS